MKCIIPSRCVKLFGRSIHCLSKIGDELFFEALKDGLALRTVNSSRSAYASFTFSKMFFYEYDQGCEYIDNSNPSDLLKCKLTMKSCLSIFKSLATIEKTVDQCKIDFRPEECRLIFTLYCKHGITKTHNLTYQECESLQAVFSKDLCPNLIVAQSKVMQDAVANFPNSCEEITLVVCPEFVKLKNYVDDEPDPSKVVHTEMTLVPEEFDDIQIGVDTQVTFCLKELRAILSFSEFLNQPVSLHFEHAGRPIVFSLDSDSLYQGDFVMATLSEHDGPTQQTINSSVSTKTTKEKFLQNKNIKSTSINAINNGTSVKKKVCEKNSEKQVAPNHQDNNQIVPGEIITKKNTDHNVDEQNSADSFFTDSFPYNEMLAMPNKRQANVSQPTPNKVSQPTPVCGNSSILRQTIPVHDNSIEFSFMDDDEVLLGTPPVRKKMKSMFFGVNDKHEESKKSDVEMLAMDTDDEDG